MQWSLREFIPRQGLPLLQEMDDYINTKTLLYSLLIMVLGLFAVVNYLSLREFIPRQGLK